MAPRKEAGKRTSITQFFPPVRKMPKRESGRVSAMEAILKLQSGESYYPHYEEALEEMRLGNKRSCWMWYIFPTLRGVRRHRMPSLLLESFTVAQEYLQHAILGKRLLEVTEIAEVHLTKGVAPTQLFGWEVDSIKFHETCSVFAVAAVANGTTDASALFIRAIRHYGGMNENAFRFLKTVVIENDRASLTMEQCLSAVQDRLDEDTKSGKESAADVTDDDIGSENDSAADVASMDLARAKHSCDGNDA